MTRRALATVVAGLFVLGGLSFLHAQQPQVDLILWNGKIVTVDERFTIAQAVAVAGDRIVAVGTNQDVSGLAGPQPAASTSADEPSCPDSSTTTCTCCVTEPRGSTKCDGMASRPGRRRSIRFGPARRT